MISDTTKEVVFQNDIIEQMVANGWQLGSPKAYNRETALYEEDAIAYVKTTQAQPLQSTATFISFNENMPSTVIPSSISYISQLRRKLYIMNTQLTVTGKQPTFVCSNLKIK